MGPIIRIKIGILTKTVDEKAKKLANVERLFKKLEYEKKTANPKRIIVINKMIEDLKKEKSQLIK